MRVQDIMTRGVETCTPATSLRQVVWLMRQGRCGIIPVIDASCRVTGVLTDRDVSMALLRSTRTAEHMAADEIMTAPVHCCRPDDGVVAALEIMKRFKVRRLPVIGRDGLLKGIVSVDDIIVRALADDEPSSAQIVASLREILTRPESATAPA
jgi:CBS domain-containing protein